MGGRPVFAFALLGLSGCQLLLGIEDYPMTLGEPCSQAEVCSEGELCDFTGPVGAVCVAVTADGDADGIPDLNDHCLHLAGGAFDEDGDGIGDECDKCPIAAPLPMADLDNDEVDSPCDPDPGMAGHRIALFDGFNGGVLGAAWRPEVAAAWHVIGGALHYNGEASSAETQLRIPIPMAALLAIQTEYRVEGDANGITQRVALGARDPSPQTGDTHITCAVERRLGVPSDQLTVQTSAGFDTASVATGTDPFSTVGKQRVAGYRNGASAGCVLLSGMTSTATQTSIGAGTLGESYLAVQATSVAFSWILVVHR